VDDEIARDEFMEIRGRCVISVSPLLAAHFLPVGELCDRNNGDCGVNYSKSF
jgi:hypothetical protein